ncbi:MAG: restriction endonuclease subunit M [Prevotella sp.]|nr:restriction endonuclease subunit M [Prevotella sp.]
MSIEYTNVTTANAERDKSGFHSFDKYILDLLLKDRTTGRNIIWATDDYTTANPKFTFQTPITSEAIISMDGDLVRPRVKKSLEEQQSRIQDKAEVFTPSYICNEQNNLIDDDWFGYKGVFNTQTEYGWIANTNPIVFPNTPGKDWKSYVKENRLEITCGEAPYLVSRYDTVSGIYIQINERIGLLDRKLRVINENIPVKDKQGWLEWVMNAYKSIYGYEWQGDNLLLARENLLYTFIEYYEARFHTKPAVKAIKDIIEIITWNLWQMDGISGVIPDSCKWANEAKPAVSNDSQISIDNLLSGMYAFDNGPPTAPRSCLGCKIKNPFYHIGIYCKIMDWEEYKIIRYVDIMAYQIKEMNL